MKSRRTRRSVRAKRGRSRAQMHRSLSRFQPQFEPLESRRMLVVELLSQQITVIHWQNSMKGTAIFLRVEN